MRVRSALSLAAAACVAVTVLAACNQDGATWIPGAASATPGTPTPGLTTPKTPSSTKTKGPTKTNYAALTCDQIRNSSVGSATIKYNDSDNLPLADGIWSGEDGHTIELTACAVGDLDGDTSVDGMVALKLTAGGTGQFWTIAFYRNDHGQPVWDAIWDLGDRNPVETIDISGLKAEITWLTRGPTDPSAALTIRRSSIVSVANHKITEITHSDAPYLP